MDKFKIGDTVLYQLSDRPIVSAEVIDTDYSESLTFIKIRYLEEKWVFYLKGDVLIRPFAGEMEFEV